MTCIVAIAEKDKIWMGCDTRMTTGDKIDKIDTKIVKKDNMILGFAGRVRDANLLKFGFKIPAQEKKMDDYEYMATIFTTAVRERIKEFGAAKVQYEEETSGAYAIIGYKNRLYKLYFDFSVTRIEDTTFRALGSGERWAHGSLFSTQSSTLSPEERINMALSAADEFCASVGKPYVIECLEA